MPWVVEVPDGKNWVVAARGKGLYGHEYVAVEGLTHFRIRLETTAQKVFAVNELYLLGEGELNGQRVILVKPQTYMNLSGDCLQQVMHFYKLPPEQLIVLCDDVDLPCGSLRIRARGSAGTHNGLKSIIACLNSENFPRIRIGAGQDVSLQLRDYVLKRPGKAEAALLAEAYEKAADAAALIVKGDVEGAQSRFNKRHEKNPRQNQEA
jgi:PTH1 family peptidyl-tRNA hydrolase